MRPDHSPTRSMLTYVGVLVGSGLIAHGVVRAVDWFASGDPFPFFGDGAPVSGAPGGAEVEPGRPQA
ncbi:MAG: hypothetical protein ACK5MT_12795 [Actinomycetales bacterium]